LRKPETELKFKFELDLLKPFEASLIHAQIRNHSVALSLYEDAFSFHL